MRAILNLALLLPALSSPVLAAAAVESGPLITGTTYTQPQQLVEIDAGRRINMYCVGTGSPTVIFESGLTDPMNVWGLVQPVTAHKTKTCSYDRAGIGFSDPGKRPSTSANIVDDLHRLLTAANVSPPYVLVGHSYGGMTLRLFASTYPSEVAGMVLVDPMTEDQMEGYRQLDVKNRTREQWIADTIEPSLASRRHCIALADSLLPRSQEFVEKCGFPQYPQLAADVQSATSAFQMTKAFQSAQLSEEANAFLASADQVRNAPKPYGNLPLVVLTKGPPPPTTSPMSPEKLAARTARYDLWVRLHDNVAKLSTRGTHKIIPTANHDMPLKDPAVVTDAIDGVLDLISDSR